jgi:sialate O-acetylesterase
MKRFLLLTFLITLSSIAEVKPARLFCDNMILQQKTANTVWGVADKGEKITVTASWGESEEAVADTKGKWKVFLKTPGFGTGFSLTVKGKNTIHIKNVAIGEVWLCAGQSNMGWAVGSCFNGEADTANVDLPDFRIFKSAREHWHEPLDVQRDKLSKWKVCNSKSAAETSAVSYYFGKKLHEELGIPVGIIVQAYAGTPIEGWMPPEIQQDDSRIQSIMKDMDEKSKKFEAKGVTKEKSLSQFETELATYNKNIAAGNIMKNKFKAHSPPIITRPSNLGHQYYGHIYNGMIHPVRPYGIRGMIWYQGERNAKDAAQAIHYRKQLAQMIAYYRSSWHSLSNGNVSDTFPVQFTQLPSWNPAQTKPVEGPEAVWSVSREMMRLVSRDVKNAYMAVSIDTGHAIDLHPKNKKPIGIRHAYLALKNTYNRKITGTGPDYSNYKIEGNKIVISFKSFGSGLMAAKPGALNSFAIAGHDKKWHWADAEIAGNTVILSCKSVSKPVAVRYAWAMNPSERNLLYNKEGLPATPFRTDEWPLYDPKADVITVLKPKKNGKESKDWHRPQMTQ